MKKTILIILSILNQRKKNHVYLFVLLSIIGAIFELIGFAFLIPVFDIVSGNQETYLEIPYFEGKNSKEILIIFLSIFLIIFLIKTVYLSFLIWWQNKFIYNLQKDLSSEIFKNFLNSSYIWHLNKNSSQLTQIIISEVNQFSLSIGWLLFLITDFLILISLICFLFFVDFRSTFFISVIFIS